MSKNRQALAVAVIAVALVEALAIALAFLVPEKRELWLVAGLTMPTLWTAAELLKRNNETLHFGVASAAIIIALPLAVFTLRTLGWIGGEDGTLALRLFGIAAGLVIVFFGNIAPKKLGRFDPANPGGGLAVQRYAGWVLVLAGFANTLVWAILSPLELAAKLSMVPLVIAIALVFFRCARLRMEKA